MRLRVMNEVRRTGDSEEKRVTGQARPEQEAMAGRWGRLEWLETECPEVHVLVNQGDLPWCR
jgi:hypothetical protein